jgi:hypothetical protein
MPNDYRYAHIYPEIAIGRVERARFPLEFPATCPACGARKTSEEKHLLRSFAHYACGGKYEDKPQIQNHTDKWWGSCPRVRAMVESGAIDLAALAHEAAGRASQ